MPDVTSSSTTATGAGAVAGTSASPSFGQSIDAEIVVLKSRLAAVEAAGKTDWAAAVKWVKANALHVALTWPAAVTVLKPVVADLLKFL